MRHRNLSTAALAAVFSLCALEAAQAGTICIDPGHGGTDAGATGCGLLEKEINLAVSLKLKPLLEAAGYTVYMTRDDDSSVSLAGRSSYANSKGVTTFASIHTNSAQAIASGIETYCYKGCLSNKANAYQQAVNIQEEMLAVWGGSGKLSDRGVKDADFHVLRETSMPATLTELGFINNCSVDAAYLGDDAHRNEAARAHCLGITRKWGGDADKCSGGGNVQPQTGKVMAGVFRDSVAEANWLGGASYTIGSQTQVTRDSYSMMTFTVDVGAFTATASKDGYQTASRSDCDPVTAGGTSWCSIALKADDPDVPNPPVSEKGKATGAVKDGASGQNVAANIRLNTGETASYDGQNDWAFDLDAGTYTVTAAADGYEEGSTSCTVTAGQTSSCPITVTPKKSAIQGAVFEAGTQDKVAATVSLAGMRVAYEGSDDFSFSVDAGTYTLMARTSDNRVGFAPCSVARGETATCNIEVSSLEGKGIIRGTLTDEQSGDKLSGDVTLVGFDQVFHYAADDYWEFVVGPGEYKVEGASNGYVSNTVTCTAVAGETVDCPIALGSALAQVEGNVYVGADPSALVAATVRVNGQMIEYDGEHMWTIELEPGEYTFEATDGSSTGSATCTIVAGKINTCDISIQGTGGVGALQGYVYDERNEALKLQASIQIEGAGSLEYSGHDEWLVEGLAEGQHTVTATAEGYYENTVVCNVVAQETTSCLIALAAIKGNGTPGDGPAEMPADIILRPGDDCSALPLGARRSAPLAIVCAFGLLGACVLRRRREV